MTKNTLFLERLSRYLDIERRYFSCWRSLANVLGVPGDEAQKFDIYTEHSPTDDLFYDLVDDHELKVDMLKRKLQVVMRNDVVEALQKGMLKPSIVFRTIMVNLFA
mgnify:CR=1 FL=1